MPVVLNLSGWISRRAKDVGPLADHIIHSVTAYEAEIERLREENEILREIANEELLAAYLAGCKTDV